MTAIRVVETGTVPAIVEAVVAAGRLDREAMTALGSRLGWEVWREVSNAMIFTTGYAIDTPRAQVLVLDGIVEQLNVDVTDRRRDPDAEELTSLRRAAADLRADLAQVLGPPARPNSERAVWDLANGGRVRISTLDRVVQLILVQQRSADVERAEERLNISEDREVAG